MTFHSNCLIVPTAHVYILCVSTEEQSKIWRGTVTSISRDMGSAAEGQDGRALKKSWIPEYLQNMQNRQKQ